jgi:hypothetical protein
MSTKVSRYKTRITERDDARFVGRNEEATYISIAEARRIMGKGSRSMTDEEIEKAIYNLTYIAREYIKSVPKC